MQPRRSYWCSRHRSVNASLIISPPITNILSGILVWRVREANISQNRVFGTRQKHESDCTRIDVSHIHKQSATMYRKSILFLICILFSASAVFFVQAARYGDRDNCQVVKISRCADFNYNYTLYPNLLQHQRQDDAESDLRQYDLLVQSECSPHLRFFLCVLFVPVCTVLNKPLPPCRTLCEEVRAGCQTLLNRYGFSWPEQFYCSRFPRLHENICIGSPQSEQDKKRGTYLFVSVNFSPEHSTVSVFSASQPNVYLLNRSSISRPTSPNSLIS